jgi:ammonium transporter Rh
MGSSADLMVEPFGAILLGTAAGVLSVVGYVYIQPFLERTIGYARSHAHTHTHI